MSRLKGVLLLASGLILGLVIGGIVYTGFQRGEGSARRPNPPSTGVRLADFSVVTLDGDKVSLSDLQGKPVVLNFWATWCVPCKQEMPLLEKYSRELDGRVVFVGLDYGEDAETVRDFVEEYGISFPIWLDEDGRVSDLYYVNNYPYTFFVDENGTLRAQHIGQLTEDFLIRYLTALGVNL